MTESKYILNLRLLLLILIRKIERYLRWRMNLRVSRSPFFIQRNKFTLSIRTVKSGSVSHSPFSILFCSAVISALFFSALVCSTVLYCTVLFCSLLFCSVLFSSLLCVLSRQEIAISRQEIRNAGRTHRIPPIANS